MVATLSRGARSAIIALALGCATPALADDAPAAPSATPPPAPARDIYKGDYFILGVGAAYVPSYEGSKVQKIVPVYGFMGRVRGVGISARSLGFALDFLPDPKGGRIGLTLGPVIRWRGAPSRRTAALKMLGRTHGNVEAGITAGIAFKKLVTGYDSLSFSSDVRFDVSRGSGARVVSLGASYFTPISHAQVILLSASMDFTNRNFSRRFYDVTAVGAAASGLPAFAGRPGARSVGVRAMTAYDLDGNLRDGGFALVGMVGYSRLQGSAADSPIAGLGGRRNQFNTALGVAYAF